MTQTDNLVSKAKKGDKTAFVNLMQMNEKYMYRVAVTVLKNDSDIGDAMQDTILTCFQKITTLKKDKYFKTWLTRILLNKCYDIINQNKKSISLEEISEITYESNDFFNVENSSLDKLCDNSRLVMTLFYKGGFSIKEIAKITGLNPNTVKTRLSRGRQEYKRKLEKEGVI